MVVEPAPHLFTADEYERMGDVFPPEARLELLGGEILEMTPISPSHGGTVDRLAEWLTVRVVGRAIVRTQGAVRISDLSEPQPDLTLLRWRDDYYMSLQPRSEDVLLMIEVSDSTASFDRRIKRPLYARAAIAELWIVDVNAQLVEVATRPRADGYADIAMLRPGDAATPTAFPDLALPLTELFS